MSLAFCDFSFFYQKKEKPLINKGFQNDPFLLVLESNESKLSLTPV